MGYDIVSGLKFSIAGFHDSKMQIWTLFYAAVLFTSSLVTVAAITLIPALVAADIVVFGMPVSTLAAAVFVLMYFIAQIFVWLFFQYQFCRNAMRLAGYPEEGNANFGQFLLVSIKTFVVNLFSWYDKRALALVAALYVLACILIAAGIFTNIMIAAIGGGVLAFAMLVHYAVMILHSVRTAFAPLIYLRDGSGGPKAPLTSFKLVKGQTMDVFVPIFAGGLVFGIVAIPTYALSIVIVGYVLLAALSGGACLYLANVFKFFDTKGPSDKQKSQTGKK